MIDPAFMPFAAMIGELLSFPGELADDWQRMRITRCELDLPAELSIDVGPDGKVELGSVPPLYDVNTTLRPSYHRIRLVAAPTKEMEVPDGQ